MRTGIGLSFNPHLSFEQLVGLSGANPHKTRKRGLLLTAATVSKSNASRDSPRSDREGGPGHPLAGHALLVEEAPQAQEREVAGT